MINTNESIRYYRHKEASTSTMTSTTMMKSSGLTRLFFYYYLALTACGSWASNSPHGECSRNTRRFQSSSESIFYFTYTYHRSRDNHQRTQTLLTHRNHFYPRLSSLPSRPLHMSSRIWSASTHTRATLKGGPLSIRHGRLSLDGRLL